MTTTTDDNDNNNNNEDIAMKKEEKIREPEINDPKDDGDDSSDENKDAAMKEEEDNRDETDENKAVDNEENEGEDADDKEEAPENKEDPDKPTVKEGADDDDDDDEASKNREDPEKPTVNEEEADDDEEVSKKEDPYKLHGNDSEDGDEDESPTKDDDDDDDFDPNENSKKKSSKKKRKAGRGRKEGEVDDSSSEPKPKKLRVKPEKVKEVSEKIIEELVKSYGWGTKEMPMDTLASNVGYKNIRSDAIVEAMKLLNKEGVVKKVKNVCMLTEDGIEKYAPAEEEIKAGNPEEALKQMWNQLENKLKSDKKTKGEKALGSAKKIWELLQDGNPHSMEEVLGVTAYGMKRSTGFPEIVNALTKALKFATKADGHLQLTEKVLKFVHPTTEAK